jgi:hypothetical protein
MALLIQSRAFASLLFKKLFDKRWEYIKPWKPWSGGGLPVAGRQDMALDSSIITE